MSRGAHEIHLRCLRVGLCCYTLFIMLFMLMFILLFTVLAAAKTARWAKREATASWWVPPVFGARVPRGWA